MLAGPGGLEGTLQLGFLASGWGPRGWSLHGRVALWQNCHRMAGIVPAATPQGTKMLGWTGRAPHAGEGSLEHWHPLQATLPTR